MDIRTYFVADITVSGVVYLTSWRKFSHKFFKGKVFMFCYSKKRQQIHIFVLQPMRYFLDVHFRREWMEKLYRPSDFPSLCLGFLTCVFFPPGNGVLAHPTNSQPGGPVYLSLSECSPLTCPARMALPVATPSPA